MKSESKLLNNCPKLSLGWFWGGGFSFDLLFYSI